MFILYRLGIYVLVILKCIPKPFYYEIKTDRQIFTEDLLTEVHAEPPAFKKSENQHKNSVCCSPPAKREICLLTRFNHPGSILSHPLLSTAFHRNTEMIPGNRKFHRDNLQAQLLQKKICCLVKKARMD